jgi:hypothetical protein
MKSLLHAGKNRAGHHQFFRPDVHIGLAPAPLQSRRTPALILGIVAGNTGYVWLLRAGCVDS